MQYKAGKRIPHCELLIIKSNEDPRRFMHQIELEGVKSPFDYVMLSIYFSNQSGKGQKMHSTDKINICVHSIIIHIGITQYYIICAKDSVILKSVPIICMQQQFGRVTVKYYEGGGAWEGARLEAHEDDICMQARVIEIDLLYNQQYIIQPSTQCILYRTKNYFNKRRIQCCQTSAASME